MQKRLFKISITNLSKEPTTLRLEPWGDEKELAANESAIVHAEGPIEGMLELEYAEKQITLYGWEGSTCEIENT